MESGLRVLARRAVDFVFPISCVGGCAREGKWLCDACTPRVLPEPLRLFPDDETLDGVVALYPYRNPAVRLLISKLKYKSAWTAIPTIQELTRRNFDEVTRRLTITKFDYIIPVPLSRIREGTRGFNQAEKIAETVGDLLGTPVETRFLLRRIRFIDKPQAKAEKADRPQNVKNDFCAAPGLDLGGASVLIVDDVFTTGATIKECARALRSAGAGTVWGFAFAHG